MRIIFLFGAIFFSSCIDKTPLNQNSSTDQDMNIMPDNEGPRILWINPRFDALIKTVSELECQIQDSSKITNVELFVDSILVDLKAIETSDTTYKFNLKTLDFLDDQEILLFVRAFDKYDNYSTSNVLRVTVDNKYFYPEPIILYPLDSLIVDSVLSGYQLKWWYSGYEYFKKYIVRKSDSSSMLNSIELFSTDKKSNVSFIDFDINPNEIIYYQILVEDVFGKVTQGNVVTNSVYPVPPQINIQSVNYNASSVFINWDPISYDKYLSHRILFSDKRDGDFMVLQEYSDSLEIQYEGLYVPYEQNWFLVQTEDSIGQISMGEPYMHSKPSEPIIDSVLYNGKEFRLHWSIETDIDFSNYSIFFSENENPFNLHEIINISSQTEDTLLHTLDQSQYFLYQIMTSDVWGLKNRGPIIKVSSFIKFSKTIDTGFSDQFSSVIVNQDGDYIVLGNSYPAQNWLYKFDKSGDLISETTLSDDYKFHSIINSSDGGIIIIGNSISMNKESIFLKKNDSFGNEIWVKNIIYETNINSNSILELNNGEIVIVGSSNINDNQNLLVIKLDSEGNELWYTVLGGSRLEDGYDVIERKNGSIIVLGTTFSNADEDGDIWLIELDSEGNSLDTSFVSIPGKQIGYSFIESESNEFIIGGTTSSKNSGVTDALLIKVNSYGEVVWQYNYGSIYNDIGRSLVYSEDGWVIVGQTYSFGKGMGDMFLLKVSDAGELIWVETMGGVREDSAYDISIASDGGYIISGSKFVNSNKDGWLIKTDTRGNVKQINLY